jgi:hypothetical protein
MTQAGVVADCDAMNFLLIHLGLREPVSAMLVACDWRVVTLDAIYRREAQDALRAQIDALKSVGRCELVDHPTRRQLEKKQSSRWKQIDALATGRFHTVSQNDRALLFEAADRGILLVSSDGPLTRLAQERQQVVLDVLDVIEILRVRNHIDHSQSEAVFAREATRRQVDPEALRSTLDARGRDHWPCAA